MEFENKHLYVGVIESEPQNAASIVYVTEVKYDEAGSVWYKIGLDEPYDFQSDGIELCMLTADEIAAETGKQTFISATATPLAPPCCNTRINYMYRDGGNWKKIQSSVISGRLTKEQKEAILASLHEGCWFIPSQVGLAEERIGQKLTDDDHSWFELYEEDFEYTSDAPDVCIGAEELTRRFTEAAEDGWRETNGDWRTDSKYAVSVEVHGWFSKIVRCGSEEEAKKLVLNLAEETDFSPLENLYCDEDYIPTERIPDKYEV